MDNYKDKKRILLRKKQLVFELYANHLIFQGRFDGVDVIDSVSFHNIILPIS